MSNARKKPRTYYDNSEIMVNSVQITNIKGLDTQIDRQTDRQIDWQLGSGPLCPMHLGLYKRALCAPYRIMVAMAPDKILITSGSKKGTQIYYFFSLKRLRKRTPSRFASGDPIDRNTRLLGIYLSLKDLIKFPLIRRPKIETPLHVPQKWGPYGNRRPFPSLASPVRSHPSSFKVPGIRDFPKHQVPSVLQRPLWREVPISGGYLNISSRVSSEGAPSQSPLHGAS